MAEGAVGQDGEAGGFLLAQDRVEELVGDGGVGRPVDGAGGESGVRLEQPFGLARPWIAGVVGGDAREDGVPSRENGTERRGELRSVLLGDGRRGRRSRPRYRPALPAAMVRRSGT